MKTVDEQDFPPLPVRTDTIRSMDLHSRVSSLHGFTSAGIRSSTPKVPPGFENTHAHPIQSLQETVSGRSTPAKAHATTIPVLPLLSNSNDAAANIVKGTRPSLEDVFRAKEVENGKEDAAAQDLRLEELGLESPKVITVATTSPVKESKRISKNTSQEARIVKDEVAQVTQAKAAEFENSAPRSNPTKQNSVLTKPSLQRPTKIEIPASITAAAANITEPVTGKSITSVMDSVTVMTPDIIPSRPATPTTATSEISRASIPRPRTIRLTTSMIQKAEAVSMSSPATEKSTTIPAVSQTKYEHSRQPSLSSMTRSRPSTPSVSHGFMSQDVSRAGSPPPGSIVGSAPGRTKTKNQLKKERREKAKKAEEPSEVASVGPSATPVAEAVGPIVARQKKQKKKATNTNNTDGKVKDTDEEKSVVPEVEPKLKSPIRETSPTKKSAKIEVQEQIEPESSLAASKRLAQTVEDETKRSYTVRDLCNAAASLPNDPNAVQTLLGENVSSMSKLMSEMLKSGDLAPDHPWLTPPSFNSSAYKLPQDTRRGQDYLDGNGYSSNDAFGYVYLPQKEKRALYAGHAVSVADTGDRKNDLLRRCLITPNGWVMRHLSAEESERVLELEERRSCYAEEFGDVGVMNGLGVLEQDDFVNLGGGMEELGRSGDRHGVCWVASDDTADEEEEDGCDNEDEDDPLNDLSPDGLSDETDEDVAVGDHLTGNTGTMPGAWDPAFNSSSPAAMGGNNDLHPNTLPPIHGGVGKSVNLRAMDVDALHKRIHEKQKEVDVTRKEAEKMEKLMAKKTKEFLKWKEGVLKASLN